MKFFSTIFFLVMIMGSFLVTCRKNSSSSKETDKSSRVDFIVERFEVRDRRAEEISRQLISSTQIRDLCEKKLRAFSWIKFVEKSQKGAYRLLAQIDSQVARSDDGTQTFQVMMLSIEAKSPGRIEDEPLRSEAAIKISATENENISTEALHRTLNELLDNFIYQLDMLTAPEDQVVKALAGQTPERILFAIDMTAQRRIRQALPALFPLLKHEQAAIADRAIGALVAIDDRSAVKQLTNLAPFYDTARLAKLLDAIASLGGDEAREYLEFVSSAHEDPDIRNLAHDALKRIRQR